jgi:hypothetical protein
MNKMLTAGASLMLGGALMLSATACGQQHDDTHGKGDAGVTNGYGQRKGNDTIKLVTNFPDGFANVATGCVAPGFRAFVTTSSGVDGRITVVADPKCNQYTEGDGLYR